MRNHYLTRHGPTPHVLAVVLAGGEGRRLWPLTADRAKPAVPIGGRYGGGAAGAGRRGARLRRARGGERRRALVLRREAGAPARDAGAAGLGARLARQLRLLDAVAVARARPRRARGRLRLRAQHPA